MKKLIAILAALAVLAVGCSSDDSLGTTASEAVAAETTTTVAETTTTVAETTTTVAPEIETVPVIDGDPDHDQIMELFRVVFDGGTTYEEKAPFIDDPSGLEATIAEYAVASESVGGLALTPTAIGISADAALVIYDLYFGENPFQVDQEGDAVRSEDRWQVTRSYFCSIMQLARVSCS